MINFLHSLYIRLTNKIRKLRKKNSWKTIPHLKDNVFFKNEFQLFDPHLIGLQTLGDQCKSADTAKEVLKILSKLENEPCINFVKDYIAQGLNTYGPNWKYADINTLLYTIGKNIKISNYLEIGVRRGRSMCVLASQSKQADFYGFDLWIENYTGVDNPGPDFVRKELSKFEYQGNLTFIDGDSKKTIPNFFRENPNLYFDVITVDGDHSLYGAKIDILNVIKKLKIGGILVFDDISSHEHPYLYDLWKKIIKKRKNFYSWEFSELGLGVAFAIRKY